MSAGISTKQSRERKSWRRHREFRNTSDYQHIGICSRTHPDNDEQSSKSLANTTCGWDIPDDCERRTPKIIQRKLRVTLKTLRSVSRSSQQSRTKKHSKNNFPRLDILFRPRVSSRLHLTELSCSAYKLALFIIIFSLNMLNQIKYCHLSVWCIFFFLNFFYLG